MRIAYFDCTSGISGDMTLGALLDAGASLDEVNRAVHSLGLDQVQITADPVKKCGFRALQVRIDHPPEHAHRHLHHIEAMFDKGNLHPDVRALASKIFRLIGEAEAKVHGVDLKKVHFHEVGAIDSIADIVGVSVALTSLGIQRVEASPVTTGSGTIEIAHGRVSVPAPATAELLQGVPLQSTEIQGELTTPTGAGILRATCQRYGALPAMSIEKIGYGAGMKDLVGQANVLKVIIGTATALANDFLIESDRVWTLETNIDDCPPSELAMVIEQVWKANALEVVQSPCMMKKNRAGITVTILCNQEDIQSIERTLFSAGVTIGIRRWPVDRHKLIRRSHSVETDFGMIAGKCVWLPEKAWRFNPEPDALKAAAARHAVAVTKIRAAALLAFSQATPLPSPE